MVSVKRGPKRSVRVSRPNPRSQSNKPGRTRPTPSQMDAGTLNVGFSFIPKASAMPAGFAIRPAVVGGKPVLQKVTQIVGQKALQPARAKKGKKIYRPPANLLSPPSLGVIKSANGKPKYSSRYKKFMKSRPDKIFGQVGASTRLQQSNAMQFNRKMQQHKITPTQFTKIIPGGPKPVSYTHLTLPTKA